MALSRAPFIAAFLRYAARLRFKQLFFITGGLFLLDLILPDFVPFADELLLGLLTLLFGAWKKGDEDVSATAPGERTIEGEVVREKPPEDRA